MKNNIAFDGKMSFLEIQAILTLTLLAIIKEEKWNAKDWSNGACILSN